MDIFKQNKNIVAWGVGKLLEFYLKNAKNPRIFYTVDSDKDKIYDLLKGPVAHTGFRRLT